MLPRWLAFTAVLAALPACTEPAPLGLPPTTPDAAEAPPAQFVAEEHGWQAATSSPLAADAAGDGPLGERCGRRDGALERVAAGLAGKGDIASFPEVAALAYELRRNGAPYVWPRAWALQGSTARSRAEPAMAQWLSSSAPQGERRCGVASLREPSGREVVVALVSDVLADLEPLPTVVGAGAWLDLRARLLVPASSVSVVVLGPRGRPFTVPSTKEADLVRARVRADRPGVWLVQLMATVSGGPRPVAEALVHADVAPKREFAAAEAPGEAAGAGHTDDEGALLAMLNGARKSEGAPPLARDAALDRLALEHAEAMKSAGRIAHDLGGGDPGLRVQAAGLSVAAAGENVAHAVSAARAHRALWSSPSHRENLLLDRFDIVGVGVAKDEDGSVWVCELFADRR